MENPEIKWVGELARVEVKPGDKFVLSVPEVISDEQVSYLKDHWKRFMGGDVPLLVLQPGMKIGVFGEAKE